MRRSLVKLQPVEEEDRTLLILSHPTVIDLITVRGKEAGYKMGAWLKTPVMTCLLLTWMRS